MDLFETDLCWDLIEQSRADGAEAHLAALRQLLSERTPEEIIRFDQCVAEWMARSYSHDLWLAFYVIRGGCSDDSFDYCRQWLILQGRILYENALKNPDSLADLEETGETEELLSLARDVYEEKTGTDLLGQSYPDYGLQGEDWSEDDLEAMKRRVPRLFEKYW